MREDVLTVIEQGRVTRGSATQLEIDGAEPSDADYAVLASLLFGGCIVLDATGRPGTTAIHFTPYGRELLTIETEASHA